VYYSHNIILHDGCAIARKWMEFLKEDGIIKITHTQTMTKMYILTLIIKRLKLGQQGETFDSKHFFISAVMVFLIFPQTAGTAKIRK
jgi:hypothetical protein